MSKDFRGGAGERNLGGGFVASVKESVQSKSCNDASDDVGRPALTIAGNHQILGQSVEDVERRRTAVGKCRLIDLAGARVLECGDEPKVTIFGTCAPLSAVGSLFQLQI